MLSPHFAVADGQEASPSSRGAGSLIVGTGATVAADPRSEWRCLSL